MSSSPIPTAADMVALPDLPHDAIMGVLRRLPVKSIKRFKCACRFWFSLLSSPEFMKAHIKHHLNDDPDRATKLLTAERSHPGAFRSCPIRSVFSSSSSSSSSWIPLPMPGSQIINGSCNGLFCVVDSSTHEYSVLLWNPSTRECRRLPPMLCPPYSHRNSTFGFGYDHSADDYKIVKIEFSYSPSVEVFSLEANSWKSVPPPSFDLGPDPGILIGGSLNWLSLRPSTPNGTRGSLNWLSLPSTPNGTPPATRMSVASFHLATEKFEIGPPFPFPHARDNLVLGVLRGCLCLAYHTRSKPTDVHVWIMKEYGTISSWSLVATLTYPPSRLPRSPKPLYVFKDHIFLHQPFYRGASETPENTLYLFDLKGKSRNNGVIFGPVLFGITDAVIYVETLVSPYGSPESKARGTKIRE